ncbi:MAG: glycosyltransferase [Planctomycetota bacterium]
MNEQTRTTDSTGTADHNHQTPLRVLVIGSSYPRNEEDYAVPWMREAHARMKSAGHEVTVLAPSFEGLRTHTIDGITVHRWRYAPAMVESLTHEEGAIYKVRKAWRQILAVPYVLCGCIAAMLVCWKKPFDVIHVHWPFPHGAIGWVARWVSGAPMVAMSHGVEFALARRKPWITPVLRWALRSADMRIANSSDTASKVTDVSGGCHCHVLPYGTTVTAKHVESDDDASAPRVLFTGRLIERKGVSYLLRAAQRVLGQCRAKFIITGNGDQREELDALHEELQLGDDVEFLGFVSNEQLGQEYSRCDVWVNPSVIDSWGDTEGLGVGSIEAYSYRKPVIASAVGGIPDTVVDGKTGYLVPEKNVEVLADRILELVQSPEKAQQMGDAGYAFAKKTFDWDRITDDLSELYGMVRSAANPSTRDERSVSQPNQTHGQPEVSATEQAVS